MDNRKPYQNRKSAPRRPRPNPAPPALPSPGRRAALEVLSAIEEQGTYVSMALDAYFASHPLQQVEKRFCTNLTYITVENGIRLSYVLSCFLKDAQALNAKVYLILRMSLAQHLFMDKVPDSAVVDEAVKLTRYCGCEGLTGLVNAVLRRAIREYEGIAWPDKETESVRYLSVVSSTPEWLAGRLIEEYGMEAAEQICTYRGSHAITVRANRLKYTDAEFEQKVLAKKVWQTEKTPYPAWYVRGALDIGKDADYRAGAFSIEGISSMLAAEAVQAKPAMQVLDCCAAPGGKTAYMAERMHGSGRIYAWDVHDHRVALIKATAQRLGLENIRPMVRDASVLREDLLDSMDAVLLDAPCTGIGVMDNKPDIKYKVTEAQVLELTALQKKLLDTVCRYVKKGGTLVYSTCSLLKEENERQIAAFLSSHPDFHIDPLPPAFGEALLKHCGENGLQILPPRDHLDGFFIARMKRS